MQLQIQLLALAALLPFPSNPALEADAETKARVVTSISSMLESNYVFPEVAKKCGAHLKAQSAAGAYDGITSSDAFADRLTTDLQSISKDLHLRVNFAPQRTRVRQVDPRLAAQQARDEQRRRNYGFNKMEIMDGNVGYLELRSFADAVHGRETAAAAMAFLANSDALIFDVRYNGGGSPEMVQFICSYLFEERTHLNSLYFRPTDTTREYWTLDEIPGPRMPEVPVYVLTSGRTFSAAEEFSYNLSTQSRAVLIGETTGGGAHPGGNEPVGDGYMMFVPSGRAINPITGTNWEGVGVKPEVEIPAPDALIEAVKEARIAAKEYRDYKAEEQAGMLIEVTALLDEALQAFQEKRADAGKRIVVEALRLALQFDLYDGGGIAGLGHQYLEEDKPDMGLCVLSHNAELHPQIPDAWYSLGEGHLRREEPQLALKAFEACLKLSPTHPGALTEAAQLRRR